MGRYDGWVDMMVMQEHAIQFLTIRGVSSNPVKSINDNGQAA